MNSDGLCAGWETMSCSSGFSWSYFYLFPFSCCLSCFILGAFIPWATIIIFQWFRKEKKITQLTFIHTHTHTHTHTPSGSLEQAAFVFGFSFTLVMPLSRYKKHLIPDFLLLASGLWPAKWNVFFIAAVQPAAELSEGKKKKKEREKKWNRNVALPLQLATLYKEIKISLAPI